jgi:REP element-mobilizing transposase RayT
MRVGLGYVHVFFSFAARYSISQVAGRLKSISAREIFKRNPEVEKQLWGGRVLGGWIFCQDGGGQSQDGFDLAIYPIS